MPTEDDVQDGLLVDAAEALEDFDGEQFKPKPAGPLPLHLVGDPAAEVGERVLGHMFLSLAHCPVTHDDWKKPGKVITMTRRLSAQKKEALGF